MGTHAEYRNHFSAMLDREDFHGQQTFTLELLYDPGQRSNRLAGDSPARAGWVRRR